MKVLLHTKAFAFTNLHIIIESRIKFSEKNSLVFQGVTVLVTKLCTGKSLILLCLQVPL